MGSVGIVTIKVTPPINDQLRRMPVGQGSVGIAIAPYRNLQADITAGGQRNIIVQIGKAKLIQHRR
jgi:hypothetical protein